MFESGLFESKIGLISSSHNVQTEERQYKNKGVTKIVKYSGKEKKEKNKRTQVGMEGERNNQSLGQLIVCLTALRAIFRGQHPWESAK